MAAIISFDGIKEYISEFSHYYDEAVKIMPNKNKTDYKLPNNYLVDKITITPNDSDNLSIDEQGRIYIEAINNFFDYLKNKYNEHKNTDNYEIIVNAAVEKMNQYYGDDTVITKLITQRMRLLPFKPNITDPVELEKKIVSIVDNVNIKSKELSNDELEKIKQNLKDISADIVNRVTEEVKTNGVFTVTQLDNILKELKTGTDSVIAITNKSNEAQKEIKTEIENAILHIEEVIKNNTGILTKLKFDKNFKKEQIEEYYWKNQPECNQKFRTLQTTQFKGKECAKGNEIDAIVKKLCNSQLGGYFGVGGTTPNDLAVMLMSGGANLINPQPIKHKNYTNTLIDTLNKLINQIQEKGMIINSDDKNRLNTTMETFATLETEIINNIQTLYKIYENSKLLGKDAYKTKTDGTDRKPKELELDELNQFSAPNSDSMKKLTEELAKYKKTEGKLLLVMQKLSDCLLKA